MRRRRDQTYLTGMSSVNAKQIAITFPYSAHDMVSDKEVNDDEKTDVTDAVYDSAIMLELSLTN